MPLRLRRTTSTAAIAVVAGTVAALTPAVANAAPVSDDAPSVTISDTAVRLHEPASGGNVGYRVLIDRDPFRITTVRQGGTVLASTASAAATDDSGPAAFHTAAGWARATRVAAATWHDGALTLTLDTTMAGDTIDYVITPSADRYRTQWHANGDGVDSVATSYDTASAGHWYGQGETVTPDGGPDLKQPWPLDSGTVADDEMGPAEYFMTEPFWFTQRGSGLYVDTENVMDVALNKQPGVFRAAVTDADSMDGTVFVERTARDVYQDYIGITGKPEKSDATAAQYRDPLWNTWAQSYSGVTQNSVLDYARGLHDAGVPGHTIQLDDGWSTHYGDFDFNAKFPDPAGLSKSVHDMGYDFGLWVTLWINNDADNYSYAADHGYLLKSKDDASKPCSVTWWNGTAGIVDLANPDARAWYVGKLRELQERYGVDGFKFDTRFFDERCAPYPGHTALDYIKLGAQLTDSYDLQGAGVRVHWTGSQRYGFVTREEDKGTGWDSLAAAVSQTMAISTVGYPFVETDMIGGSDGQPPATKDVLVRWAQAASLMPLMYSSTSPLGLTNPYGSQKYDAETVQLYSAAVRLHERLAPYIERQVQRALASGEPIMKPLFFDFPKDTDSYAVDNEWLLGDTLLAAPVLTDATQRSVHLPAGRWYDVLNHREIEGGRTITGYSASLGQTPMFVRLDRRDSPGVLRAVLG